MDAVEIRTTTDTELNIPTADEQFSPYGIGRSTYNFVRRCMRDPALRARIRARAAEIRANGEYGLGENTEVAGHE